MVWVQSMVTAELGGLTMTRMNWVVVFGRDDAGKGRAKATFTRTARPKLEAYLTALALDAEMRGGRLTWIITSAPRATEAR
jgi:hypothetical protein